LAALALAAGAPDVPGVEWSDTVISVMRKKIDLLFDKPKKYVWGKFSLNSSATDYNKYVYDPTGQTLYPPRDRCIDPDPEGKCDHIFNSIEDKHQLDFSAEKVLRLAFHDCIPYITEEGVIEGGCDGCLNMDQDLKGNMGLQYTIATLEKLYQEPDYPYHKKHAPMLPGKKSPKDLGISRADLWAFAGIVALDRFLTYTRDVCGGKEKTSTATCRWWERPEYDASQCFHPLPASALSMFKTGRSDCRPSGAATEFQQYLASRAEHHPDDNGNGEMTVSYYDRAFGFNGREGLALMGVHAVGKLNSVFSGNAYSWVRDARLFNNKYYKLMAGTPDRVFESCTGTLDDQPAPGSWVPIANIHLDIWREEEVWATEDRAGHIRWDMSMERGPDCGSKHGRDDNSFGWEQDNDDYWGRRGLWADCCTDKMACFRNATCRDLCTFNNGNKQRFIGADVGYVLKWELEAGLPRGCEVFKNKRGEDMTHDEFRSAGQLRKDGQELGCPRQDLDDGEGRALADTVEHFARDNEDWVRSFTAVFSRMQANGYTGDQLYTQDLAGFFKHME